MTRQQAPSLEAIAASPSGVINDDQQDSRSSSSTSSPAPAEYEESDFFLGANDSQSSLGVPNLQDMQVNDDECLPPIQRLPNEILISIFAKLTTSTDQLHCMLTCKRWARNSVDQLWHRPACTSWKKHSSICQTLGLDQPYFAYRDFIKRLNLAALAEDVSDGSVIPLAVCSRVERLTLTNCKGLTDTGLIALVRNSDHLLALDISGDEHITESSIFAIAENCRRLQGLNVSNCKKISNESMISLAEACRYIKRLKLNDCSQLTDDAILAFAEHCPNILEIDLQHCKLIGNAPVTALLAKGQSLRELRLASCDLIDDSAFLSLPPNQVYEHLRILDLTSCVRLTDRAVEKIIDVAPRLRNLVLAKCRNITDVAVYAISRLGKNLHYVHLGHCIQITDEAVKRLVHCCNRIRYIDLGCCSHLTDDSVTKLATLPKLKRIGLVKCSSITDESVYALAKANQRFRHRRDAEGNIVGDPYPSHSSLERVHLSYCTSLTLRSIIKLLNSCPRLTHLSLTGVQAFLRQDLEAFCRDAPPEFTEHQRNVFCVFSGQGVMGLRRYLNNESAFADLRDRTPSGYPRHPNGIPVVNGGGAGGMGIGGLPIPDGGFDDQEADVVDDDDGLDDGSEMVIDAQPLPAAQGLALGMGGAGLNTGNIPPPPPHMAQPLNPTVAPWQGQGVYTGPPVPPIHFPGQPIPVPPLNAPIPVDSNVTGGDGQGDAMDVSPAHTSASTAPVGGHTIGGPSRTDTSTAGAAAGPSTASIARTSQAGGATPFQDGYETNGSRSNGESSSGA